MFNRKKFQSCTFKRRAFIFSSISTILEFCSNIILNSLIFNSFHPHLKEVANINNKILHTVTGTRCVKKQMIYRKRRNFVFVLHIEI